MDRALRSDIGFLYHITNVYVAFNRQQVKHLAIFQVQQNEFNRLREIH